MSQRLTQCFAHLKTCQKSAYISFITAGDPTYRLSEKILLELPQTGVDIVELGMPFSDPMADGPIIQASSLRAIEAGHTMNKTFHLVDSFRNKYDSVPLILMGYYNLILSYGKEKFLHSCREKGVDGLIIVDLPAGEEKDFYTLACKNNVDIIYLIAPTTSPERLKVITQYARSFLYYVMITGITGTKSANLNEVRKALDIIRQYTQLSLAVGFGVKNVEDAQSLAKISDAVVVGSALVDRIANIDINSHNCDQELEKLYQFSKKLALGIKDS